MNDFERIIRYLFNRYLTNINAIELLRFFSIGLINTIFCYCIYTGLVAFGFETVFAMTIATIFTVIISFYMMGRYVFGADLTTRRAVYFFMMQFVGYIVNIKTLNIAELTGYSENLSGLISLAISAFVTFFISKFCVFKK